MAIADVIETYGYLAVAVGTFLEGETVLGLAGAAASRGHLSMPVVIAVATMASFAGDQLYFYVGRKYGIGLLARFPSLQSRTVRARDLLERHHMPVILSIRFLYGLRIAGPIAIGMSDVPWLRFLLLNLVAAIAWALVIANAGYWVGQALANLLGAVDADEAWVLAVLLLFGVLWWLAARYREQHIRGSNPSEQQTRGD
jgi:membrane protein DedA with SNARE-associated domain